MDSKSSKVLTNIRPISPTLRREVDIKKEKQVALHVASGLKDRSTLTIR